MLMLYADPILPKRTVNDVISYMKKFVGKMLFVSIKKDIILVFEKYEVSPLVLKEVLNCIQNHEQIFIYIDTEDKRSNLLKQRGLIEPKEFVIGSTYEECLKDNKPILEPVSLVGFQIPLRKSLKAFLEIPGMFVEIFNYMKELSKQNDIITNILQSELWIKKYSKKFANDIVMPLFVFYDDVEVGNPLGSHAGTNKFGAVYATIVSLPPWLSSTLDSIIFSTLIRSKDKKKTTNAKLFKSLIEELNFLQENGIIITDDGRLFKIKFQVVLILGDNLGINEIFGFVTSFRTNFCCRVCEADKSAIVNSTVEDKSKLRTKDNYKKNYN